MLHHSELGYSNLHLFFDVKAVLYVEGGSSGKGQDILAIAAAADDRPKTSDERFWDVVVAENNLENDVHVISVGPKPFLKEILGIVTENGSSTCLIALDRDYDEVRGDLAKGPNVLHTWGYSWENDVATVAALWKALTYLQGGPLASSTKREIGGAFTQFFKNIRKPVVIDEALIRNGCCGLIDRERPTRHISVHRSNLPCLNMDSIIGKAKSKKEGKTINGLRPRKIRKRLTPGKLVHDFLYHLFFFACINRIELGSVPKSVFRGLIITAFAEVLSDTDSNLAKYYHKELGQLKNAVA